MEDLTMANDIMTKTTAVSVSLNITTLAGLREFCEVLAKTNMVPKAYLDKPDDILVAMLHGQEVGLPHLQALQSIAVVNGIPSIFGDAALAMVRASGKLEDFDEYIEVEGVRQERDFPIMKYADEDKEIVAVCRSKRVGMTRERVTTYSVRDAKRAKLWEKKGASGFETPWCTVPQRMLMWRARGWNLRDNFGDVLKGLAIYEEAMDIETTRDVSGAYKAVEQQEVEAVDVTAMQEQLRKGQEALKQKQEVPKEETAQQSEPEKQPQPKPAEKPVDPAWTMAKARLMLKDTTDAKVVAAIFCWSFDAEGLTPENRKEIQLLKDQACERMSKKVKR
jgi:hypothetical protein